MIVHAQNKQLSVLYILLSIPMDCGVKCNRDVYHKEAFWRNLTRMNMLMQKLVHESLSNHIVPKSGKELRSNTVSISESCNPLFTVVVHFCKVFVHIKISHIIHIFTYSTLADIRSPCCYMKGTNLKFPLIDHDLLIALSILI